MRLLLIFILLVLFIGGCIQQNNSKRYFDWTIKFTLYDDSKNGPEGFPSDEIFEREKNKILFLIPRIEYKNYKETYTTYNPIRNGFSIEVTQKGYEIIQKRRFLMHIISLKYLSTISYSIIIDPDIQIVPNKENKITECGEDRECIKIKQGCCGCSMGGKATTINRKYYDYWAKNNAKNCVGTGCMAVISNDWTCFAEPKCTNSECQLVK